MLFEIMSEALKQFRRVRGSLALRHSSDGATQLRPRVFGTTYDVMVAVAGDP